jgi:hypothetical protein
MFVYFLFHREARGMARCLTLKRKEKVFYLSLIKEILELTRAETTELGRSFKMAFYPLVYPFWDMVIFHGNGKFLVN